MLTPEEKEMYVATGGTSCPYCHAEDFVGHSIEVRAGYAYQEITCSECDRSRTDTYTLTGIEEEDSE